MASRAGSVASSAATSFSSVESSSSFISADSTILYVEQGIGREVDEVAHMRPGEMHPQVRADIEAAEAAGAAEEAARAQTAGPASRPVVVQGAGLDGSRAGSVASSGGNMAEVFNFNGGSAVRDPHFRDVWRPRRPENQLDVSAAHEGARIDAQAKANALPFRERPGMIAVVQDEAGNAFGGHSVRGANNQGVFGGRLTNCQHSVLDKIPDGNRGAGHGNCAEQVIAQNVRHIQYKQQQQQQQQGVPQLFTGQRNVITSYRPRARGAPEYNRPTPACNTCRVTNQFFGFQDGAGPSNTESM